MAVILGLHLNMPAVPSTDPAQQEHRIRVWWTAYTLDRMWASMLGCPPAIQDEDVKVDLPSQVVSEGALSEDFGFAGYYSALAKLSGILMRAVRSIYTGRDQGVALFVKVQERVRELKAWVKELPPCLHLGPSTGTNPAYHNYDVLALHLTLNQVFHSRLPCFHPRKY